MRRRRRLIVRNSSQVTCSCSTQVTGGWRTTTALSWKPTACTTVSGSGRVILWLNAVGAAVEAVDAFLREAQVPYRRSYPVPMEQVGSLLVTPDAHLITLSDAFVGFVLPSKVYGCVASKKPILYIGSERSDVHQICLKSEAYYRRVAVGDVSCMRFGSREFGRPHLAKPRRWGCGVSRTRLFPAARARSFHLSLFYLAY